MAGQGCKRRRNVRAAQEKKLRKKAVKNAAKNPTPEAALSVVTEVKAKSKNETSPKDDLLAYQTIHFGDDTKPQTWIVDAEDAIEYNPAWEDDGLGFYDDGVKRTLTDEQIAMFRHSEIEILVRDGRMTREDADKLLADVAEAVTKDGTEYVADEALRAGSAVSETASFETKPANDRRENESPQTPKEEPGRSTEKSSTQKEITKQPYESRRSNSVNSTGSHKRKRKEDIPYSERHKRKWEDYIEDNDPVEGSITHRRKVRELDEIPDEAVDLEY